MKALMEKIEQCLPEGGQWCSLEKAQTLAALVVGLRPRVVVEIGVWMGGSLVPMLLALKQNGAGKVVAIDPWSPDASKAGEAPANAQWWGGTDHEQAFRALCGRLDAHGVASYCEIWRQRSDDCTPPAAIDLLHVDGNHSDQAVRDVQRFAPSVAIGGVMIVDDVAWVGGHVGRALELARGLGFVELYPLGTGIVMQRRSSAA